jgi:hypothetical protein
MGFGSITPALEKLKKVILDLSTMTGPETREYGCGDPLCCQRNTLYPLKLVLTSPTSGSCSVGIVLSRTKATMFVLFVVLSTAPSSEWKFEAFQII